MGRVPMPIGMRLRAIWHGPRRRMPRSLGRVKAGVGSWTTVSRGCKVAFCFL